LSKAVARATAERATEGWNFGLRVSLDLHAPKIAAGEAHRVAVIVLAALATANLIRLRAHNHTRSEGPTQPMTQPSR
jgi:hypothetical protein